MNRFDAVNKQTLADVVYEQMQTAIVRGDFEEGAELNQVALAQQFGVSRVPVREALWRLEAEHLVFASPQQRFRVAQPSPESIIEMAELREELEVFALRKRMHAGYQDDLERIREAARALPATGTKGEWLMGDRQFHRLLIGGTGPIAGLIDGVRVRIHRYLHVVVSTAARRREAESEHAELIATVATGDADKAERILRDHISATRLVLESHLRRPSPEIAQFTDGANTGLTKGGDTA